MTVSDYIELGALALWLVCIIGVGVLSHVHFRNVKAEKYRQDALFAMKKWVGYYDKQDLDNPQKANMAVDDVVKELRGKGYTISDQSVKDLEALREYVLTQLRMKQAETGVHNTVKTTPDVVPVNEIVEPTEPGKPYVSTEPQKTAGGAHA